MKRMLLSFALAIAAMIGGSGCFDAQPDTSNTITQEAKLAPAVTVSVPIENTTAYDGVSIPEPPPWGFFSAASNYSNYYFPIHGLPLGSVISKVQARVFAQPAALCEIDFWRMNDFFALEPAPFGTAMSQVSAGAVTLTISANVPVTSLTKLYVVLKGRPANQCLIMAAEVTYTPPA